MLTKEECINALTDLKNELQDILGDESEISECVNVLCKLIREYFAMLNKLKTGDLSDGYHTFNELYHHRAVLFSVIVNQNQEFAWKSKKHHDGTMYDGMFIVGIDTPQGQYSYHYDLNLWDLFDVKELENAPEWDGHKPQDIDRLKSLNDNPPLKFEELKQGMWVWDNRLKWFFKVVICNVKVEGYESLKMFKVENYEGGSTLTLYEPNRFYRKEVQE